MAGGFGDQPSICAGLYREIKARKAHWQNIRMAKESAELEAQKRRNGGR